MVTLFGTKHVLFALHTGDEVSWLISIFAVRRIVSLTGGVIFSVASIEPTNNAYAGFLPSCHVSNKISDSLISFWKTRSKFTQ